MKLRIVFLIGILIVSFQPASAQSNESYILSKDEIPQIFLTSSKLSIPIMENANNIVLYFQQKIPLDDLILLFGPFQNEISFDGDPLNRTYIWSKNGSFFIVSLRNKIDLIQVYSRMNAPFSMLGLNPMPWTYEYMEEKFGKPGKAYGDESLKLIPYLNEKIPFTRFDYEVSRNQITGFQIFGPWRDNIEKKRNGLKIRE